MSAKTKKNRDVIFDRKKQQKLEALHSRAKYLARKYGFYESSEDCAQEVILSYLQKPEKKQSGEQSVIDWIRKNGPRTRRGSRRMYLQANEHPDEEVSRQISVSPLAKAQTDHYPKTFTAREFP